MRTFRKLVAILLLVILTFSVTACNRFSYDKEAAITRAKEYIERLNARDYETVYNSFPENMAKMHTLDDYRTRYDLTLESAGDFIEYRSAKTTIGSHVISGESLGEYEPGEYALAEKLGSIPKHQYIYVVITAKHVTGTITYTIALTTDMELAELNFTQKPA